MDFFDKITNWNSSIINQDGLVGEELLKRLKYGAYVYGEGKMVEAAKYTKSGVMIWNKSLFVPDICKRKECQGNVPSKGSNRTG